MTDFEMRDAAFASGLAGWRGAVAGYLGGPNAFRTWTPQEWRLFPGQPKLPIWVAGFGGAKEGAQVVALLRSLGVSLGKTVAVDMEGRVDSTYLNNFAAEVQWGGFGYKVWVYGQTSTVFGNPKLNGYWAANYPVPPVPFMFDHAGVRATQYASGDLFDSSLVKEWEKANLWT
jgi:hypothetical protein